MMSAPINAVLAPATGFAAAGLAFGSVYFASMRRGVAHYCAGGRVLRVAALTVGRLALALLFFALAARWGATPLLAALAGFLVARTLAIRAVRSRAV